MQALLLVTLEGKVHLWDIVHRVFRSTLPLTLAGPPVQQQVLVTPDGAILMVLQWDQAGGPREVGTATTHLAASTEAAGGVSPGGGGGGGGDTNQIGNVSGSGGAPTGWCFRAYCLEDDASKQLLQPLHNDSGCLPDAMARLPPTVGLQ